MRERDRNQPLPVSRSRRPPLPTIMSNDKQSTISSTSKPLTPTLSSSSRNVREPLTPRVAGSPSPSPSLCSARQPFIRSKSPPKPDQTTTPWGGNVTPRSAARQSRVGTESPLTPAQSRVPVSGPRSRASSGDLQKPATVPAQGLGITSPRLAASTPSLVKSSAPLSGPVVTVHRRVSAAKSLVEGGKDISSKFFHANEVTSAIGSSGLEDNQRFPPKPGHFFVGSAPLPLFTDNVDDTSYLDAKFVRANDIPQQSQQKHTLPDVTTDKLTATGIQDQVAPPSSPRRIPNAHLSPRKYREKPSPTSPRTTAESPQSSSSNASAAQLDVKGHRKSWSTSSVTSLPLLSGPRPQAPVPLELLVAPTLTPLIAESKLLSPDTLSPRSFSLTSTSTIPTTIASETEVPKNATHTATISATISDTKSESQTAPTHPQADQASNARRERKVLDLEISNSSLLAINKTLEREVRKQTTELRRFRRLSRSGRLSIAPTVRTVSEQSTFSLGTVTELDDADQHLSDFDSGNSELYDDENSSLFSADSSSHGLTSPRAQSRQRVRDEKRLMQDLTRHHQLLLESQTLNQSIRRCLTCTDDLIREGNKALEYRVGIGDMKLGGKVLNDEELDERGLVDGINELQARQGLLSPSVAKANLDEAFLWARQLAPIEAEPARESTGMSSVDKVPDLLEPASAETHTADAVSVTLDSTQKEPQSHLQVRPAMNDRMNSDIISVD